MANTSRKKRIYTYSFILTVCAVIIIIAHLSIMMIKNRGNAKNYIDPVCATSFVRGNIYDTKGRLVATDKTMWTLSILLEKTSDLTSLASFISPYTGQSVEQILSICDSYTSFARLTRDFDPDKVEDFLLQARERKFINSVVLETYQGRYYPYSYHGSNLLGFVGWDGFGLEGVELYFETYLRAKGRLGTLVSHGYDVYLSLDMDVQYALDVAIQEMADENPSNFCLGLILNGKTGEVLACSSKPWYNPNSYYLYDDKNRNNLVFNSTFEPGSVFKIFSLASVLEAGQADFSQSFHCDGSYTFTNNSQSFTITCHEAHGDMDIDSMIAKSCNAAIANWALETDDQSFLNTLLDFGFSRSPQCDIPSSKGLVYPVSQWSNRSKATMAFGQELTVTALQLCTAATCFANCGFKVDPVVVKSIKDKDKSIYEALSGTGRQVITEQTASTVLKAMKKAASDEGTAKLAQVQGIDVAAKTGTSQLLGTDSNNLASTLAIAGDYVIYVASYNPTGSTIWGANIASPAISKIIKSMASQGLIKYEGI